MITTLHNMNELKDHDFMIFEILCLELCNLHCTYCYMRNDSPTWESFYFKKNIIKIIDFIASELSHHNPSICLSGGECTLHPNFIDFVKLIDKYIQNKKLRDIHINTNLSLSKEKIQEVIDINKDCWWHVSYHIETDVDEFFEKILYLHNQGQHIEFNIMIHPAAKYKDKIDKLIELAKSHNIDFYLKPVYINATYKPTKYVMDILEIYKDDAKKEYIDNNKKQYNDYDLLKGNLVPMDTKGWDCYYSFFTIRADDGKIKQMCRLFPELNLFKDIEFFKNYDLSKPVTCTMDYCLWASSLDQYKERK